MPKLSVVALAACVTTFAARIYAYVDLHTDARSCMFCGGCATTKQTSSEVTDPPNQPAANTESGQAPAPYPASTPPLQANTPAQADTPAPTGTPKEQWLEGMRMMLPVHFCREQMYFRQCFDVSESECLAQARRATLACLNETEPQLPSHFDRASGTKWGTVVGSCAGTRYESELRGKMNENPRCQDASNWTP